MLDWVLNTALPLQTLFQLLVSLKYFTSFSKSYQLLGFKFWKKYYTYIKKNREKMVILLS